MALCRRVGGYGGGGWGRFAHTVLVDMRARARLAASDPSTAALKVTLATAPAAGLAVPVCCLVLADGHHVAAVVQPFED